MSTGKLIFFAALRGILLVEPIFLAVTLFAFWYPSPDRDPFMPLLLYMPLAVVARLVLDGRPWPRSLLEVPCLVLVGLMLINIQLAPYTRGSIMLGRPLLGIALCIAFTAYARRTRTLTAPLAATLGLALLVAFLALTGTQWNSKSLQFEPILRLLPRFTAFPAAEGGFNGNEIAGALCWLAPMAAGIAGLPGHRWRWGSWTALVLLLGALLLGQSRFALIGTLGALAVMTPLVIRERRGRLAALGALAALAVFELLIIANVFAPANRESQLDRDESSFSQRFNIWNSALAIISDYPGTGVGLNMFRDRRVREQYPVPTYNRPVLPHTHNEVLQAGTDMGLPGMVVFVGLYAAAGYALVQSYRVGDRAARAIAAGIGAGLLAHAVYGLGDAVALWDRFAFVWWWLLALASAQWAALTTARESL